ncbi:MAG TPA: 1,2-phenylacetyl-CoA epoxidase subunit PaaD [Chitinophagaceae bacterium]|jgi:ring-1,2-phenylacetyl-CoA epoxidase subunit PaaD|nr:1,2-phenylacetyl-CoA epoxidase subunit PaaD [Chitinophagaceae bacterium]
MVINPDEIWKLLSTVKDPEIPVLSVTDLGVVRLVDIDGSNIHITITPTYSGCPAMDFICTDIRLKLLEHGYKYVTIKQQLSPAWTTDWMSDYGKEKLKSYGIAPPNPRQQFCKEEMFQNEAVQCPLCNSFHTELISQFGSTACKAMYRCTECKEAFDYFKCH